MVAFGGEEPNKSDEKILVVVRLRPLSEKEIQNNEISDLEYKNEKTIVFQNSLQERSIPPSIYKFDRVFNGESSTRQVYEEGTREIALSVVSGINSSILAYGQTSSGKTYTMSGIMEYAVADIYDYIIKHEERAFNIKFSAMEIYNEVVGDLLSTDNTPLRIRDDPEKGAFVENLTEENLRDWGHLKELLSICQAQRRIGETSLNKSSSRSHQIVRLTVESSPRESLGKENSAALSANLNFVDLAGSERTSQTSTDGERMKEGCHINSSLFTLGNVIRKLSLKTATFLDYRAGIARSFKLNASNFYLSLDKGRQRHVSYRDSKLTRILQPCLGGNARTAMICTLSPARVHAEQSRNTLFFANCAKEVNTNAKVNVVISDKALLKRLQREVARLETELRVPAPSFSCDCAELVREKDRQIEKLATEISDLTNQLDLAESRVEELQLIIENYRSSRKLVERDDFLHWQAQSCDVQCDETDESSQNEISESITRSTGDDEAISLLMVCSYGNEAFESSSPYEKEISDPKFGNQMSFEQWGPSESRLEGSLLEVQDLCERDNSPQWQNQCTETDDISEEENLTLNVHNDGKEEIGLSSPTEEEKIAIAKYREQWDFADLQGEIYESSDEEIIKSAALTGNDYDKTPNSTIKYQSLTSISSFSSSMDLTVPSLSSESSTKSQNPGFLPSLSAEFSFSSLADAFLLDTSSTSGRSSREEKIPSVQNFVAGLKASVKLEYEKGVAKKQDNEQNTEKSNTNWAVVFVRLQKQILELWQICNISLVHRTYFFLLFKGEPNDSIYMEIELRRLTYLKEAFSKGNHAMDGGQTLTLESSKEALCREREMLTRLLEKKLSRSERDNLYKLWAVNLESKQRKRRFINLLWSRKNDLQHIMESAEVVGQLIGFSKQGATLKEMFGLSFGFSSTSKKILSFSRN